MNPEEIKSLISQLKGVGLDDEKILEIFFDTFKEGKMDKEDLKTLAGHLGYEFTEEFEKDNGEGKGEGEVDEVTKDKIEDLKEIKPGESDEHFQEKVEDVKEDLDADSEEEKGEEKEDDEEEEILSKYYKV